jgi:hypothetical protein
MTFRYGFMGFGVGLVVALAAAGCGDSNGDDDAAAGESGKSGSSGSSSSGGSGNASGGSGNASSGGAAVTPPRGGSGGTSGSSSGGSPGTGGRGGTPAGISCDAFDECGGDPTGTWNVRDSCFEFFIEPFAEYPACQGAFQSKASVTGSYTLVDGTVTWDTVVTVDVAVTISDACASDLAGSPITAAELCPSLEESFMEQGTFASADCGGTSTCVCDLAMPPETSSGTDTYVLSGNTLVDSEGDVTGFCVEGDVLSLQTTTDEANATMTLERAP